jgi:hypothetical protein
MKRALMVAFLAIMLAFMAFPDVRADSTDTADTSTMTPYDWLTQDEKAYVDSMRADDADCHAEMAVLKNLLSGLDLKDAWYTEYNYQEGKTVAAFSSLYLQTPPDEFAEVQTGYSDMVMSVMDNWPKLPNFKDLIYEGFLPPEAMFNLISAAADYDGYLSAASGKLSAMRGKLEGRVIQVGNGLKLANQILGNALSCEPRPARAY